MWTTRFSNAITEEVVPLMLGMLKAAIALAVILLCIPCRPLDAQVTTPVANLGLTKTGPAAAPKAWTTFVYTMIVSNAGPSAATSVILTDTPPSGVEIVSGASSQGRCNISASFDCLLGTLLPSGTATVTLAVRATAPGTFTNTALVVSSEVPDSNNFDNSATAVVNVVGVDTPDIVPVVGDAPGLFGSHFKTSIQIFNPNATAISGTLRFHPAGQAGQPTDPELPYTLNPRQTRGYPDLLSLFPPGTLGLGSLDIIPATGEAPRGVARVYNDEGPLGTSGMTEDVFGSEDVLFVGQRAALLAPPDFANSRMNVGVRSLATGAVLSVTTRSTHGLVLQHTTHQYDPDSFSQVAAPDFTRTPLTGNESITIEVLQGAAIAYAAITDNTTGDPSSQFATAIPQTEGPERGVLTVVGSTEGASGAFFRTSVQMYNPNDGAIDGTINYRPAGQSAIFAALPYTLAPHQTRFIDDLLPAMNQSGLGTADVVSSTGPAPVVVARVFDDAGSPGTRGLMETMIFPNEALQPGASATLFAPLDTVAFRWNIGVRALGGGADVTIIVRRADGSIQSTITKSYPPNYFEQIPAHELLGEIANDQTATFTVSSGSLLVYGSTIDNQTQDPSVQFGRVRD